MDMQLEGKVALVTGSSAETGAAIARQLAEEGARVIVHGRDRDGAERVASDIRSAGGEAAVVLGELGDDLSAADVVEKALAAFGELDILVNNAGAIGYYEQWVDTSADDWARMYDGVVLVVVRVVNRLIPYFETRGWGRIVTVASAQGGQPFAMMPDYAAAKLALLNLTVSLSKRLDRTGVRVNVVSPGIIATKQIRERLTEAAQKDGRSTAWEEIERHTLETELNNPTGRLARSADVANLVTFLCSPRADYVNGANVRIDGGSNITIQP